MDPDEATITEPKIDPTKFYQDVWVQQMESGKTERHRVFADVFEPPIFADFGDIWIRIFTVEQETFYYKLADIHKIRVGIVRPIEESQADA